MTRISNEIAAWAGIIGVVLSVLNIWVSVLLFDGFEWGVHNLSTLGHVDMAAANSSRLVFSSGLIVTALLGLVFTVGLYRLEDRRLWQSGAVLWAISHLAVIWLGIFPAGVPQHDWLAIVPFVVGAVLFILIGIDQIRVPETRLFGIVVLSNLAVGLTGVGLLLQTDIEGFAIHETIGIALSSVVTLLYAARLLGVVEPSGDDGSTAL